MADEGDPLDAYEELSLERAAPLLPVDCLLMTATRVELRVLRPELKPLDGRERVLRIPWHESTYYIGRIGRYCCGLTMSDPGSAGRAGAILTLHDAARRLDPSFTIAVGIAFGKDPKKQNIGDVLASATVIPYENQRVQPGGSIPRSPHPEAGATLLNRLKLLDSEDMLDGAIQFGPLLSGEKLVDDPEFKKQLFAQFPAAIGGEMEAAGIYAAAERSKIEWLVVKAICDWGDGKKTKKYQEMAAAKATAAVVALLGRGGLERSVFRRDSPPAPDVLDLSRGLMLETAVLRVRHADRARQETSEALAAELRSLIGADGTPRFSSDPSAAAVERAKIDDIKRKHAVALEAWLNTYNDAASKYLSARIDAIDFERALGLEIIEIVELDGPHRERLVPRESSAYAALWSASDRLKARGLTRAPAEKAEPAAVPCPTIAASPTPAVIAAPGPHVAGDDPQCVAVDHPPDLVRKERVIQHIIATNKGEIRRGRNENTSDTPAEQVIRSDEGKIEDGVNKFGGEPPKKV